MSLGFIFIWLILNSIVNMFLGMIIPTTSIEGLIAYYLLSCLIMAFIAALFATPAGFRKDFYKHPGFHKTMLMYFALFAIIDVIFIAFGL